MEPNACIAVDHWFKEPKNNYFALLLRLMRTVGNHGKLDSVWLLLKVLLHWKPQDLPATILLIIIIFSKPAGGILLIVHCSGQICFIGRIAGKVIFEPGYDKSFKPVMGPFVS